MPMFVLIEKISQMINILLEMHNEVEALVVSATLFHYCFLMYLWYPILSSLLMLLILAKKNHVDNTLIVRLNERVVLLS